MTTSQADPKPVEPPTYEELRNEVVRLHVGIRKIAARLGGPRSVFARQLLNLLDGDR